MKKSLLILFLLLFSAWGSFTIIQQDEVRRKTVKLGFYSPGHLDDHIYHTDFSILNVYLQLVNGQKLISLEKQQDDFSNLQGLHHKVHLNLGPMVTEPKDIVHMQHGYITSDGRAATKVFTPLKSRKVFRTVYGKKLLSRLQGLAEFIKKHRKNIGNLIVMDEPYINGITKENLEQTIKTLREYLNQHGLEDIRLQVNFAGAMFNSDFAHHLSHFFDHYVEGIDNYYQLHKKILSARTPEAVKFRDWVATIEKYRLVTYDQAGNIYTGGGIPEGIDVISFDCYISSLLFDHIYNDVLDWFWNYTSLECCQPFADMTQNEIRKQLSFFQDGPVRAQLKKDKKFLDQVFTCRMEATLRLLLKELDTKRQQLDLMLIGESSANGLLEFDSRGNIESGGQPVKLIEQRMLNEVQRTITFYQKNQNIFQEGVAFFIFQNNYDASINLMVYGAKGSPAVLNYLYEVRNCHYEGNIPNFSKK